MSHNRAKLNFSLDNLKMMRFIPKNSEEQSDYKMKFAEFDFNLSFDDEYSTRLSIVEYLDILGFSTAEMGYDYLIAIFTYLLETPNEKQPIKNLYVTCAAKYKTNAKCVEVAINTAIKNASRTGQLGNLNKIFTCYKVNNDHISSGAFITMTFQRFAISKIYKKPIVFSL